MLCVSRYSSVDDPPPSLAVVLESHVGYKRPAMNHGFRVTAYASAAAPNMTGERSMFGREFVLITSLKPDQVADALNRRSEIVGATDRPTGALFEGGLISSEKFELKLIGQRNHAKAHIRGEIASLESGSKVAVRVGAGDPFGAVWSAGCMLSALVSLFSIRSWAQVPAGLGVAAGGMALFMLYRFLARRAFDLSASTAELALKDALSATAADPAAGK